MKGLAFISAAAAVFLAACFFLLIHSCGPERSVQDHAVNKQLSNLPDPAALGSVLYEDALDPLFIAAGLSSGYRFKGDGIPAELNADSAKARIHVAGLRQDCVPLVQSRGVALMRLRNRFDSLISPMLAALRNRNKVWLDSAAAWYTPLMQEHRSGKINQDALGSRLLQLNGQVRDSLRNDAERQRLASSIRKEYEDYLNGVKQQLSEQEWQEWVLCCLRNKEQN